jgi:acetolactate synthase-1/2/3 large subunit
MKASDVIISALKQEGVSTVFTVPGEHILPLLHAAYKEVRVINAKLEISAAFMTLAYSRLTRDIGVQIAISGPGLIGSLSPIAQAFVEGDAMIILATVPPFEERSGAIMHKLANKDDQAEVTKPVTKGQYALKDFKSISNTISEAFSLARSGKPGPVYIEVPLQVLTAKTASPEPYVRRDTVRDGPSEGAIDQVFEILINSRKISVIAGRGVYLSGAERELIKFSELLRAPVMTTIMAKGIVPPDHPLYGGVAAGLAGDPVARTILKNSDVVLSLGNRFSEMGTGRFSADIPGKLIHVNIFGGDASPIYRPYLEIRSDIKKFLGKLFPILEKHASVQSEWDFNWIKNLWEEEYENHRLAYEEAEQQDTIKPWLVVREIERTISRDAIIIGDVGAHRIETFLMRVYHPGSYLTTTSYVSMGLAVPAAVASCLAYPQRQVVAIVGDGAFLMTGFEVSTALQYGLSPKIIIFNDSSYKVLKIYEMKNYGSVSPKTYELPAINFAKLAEGMGAVGITVSKRTELRSAFSQALQEHNLPVVVEVMVDPEAIPLPYHDLYGVKRINDITPSHMSLRSIEDASSV